MNIQEAKYLFNTELNQFLEVGELDEIFLRIAEHLTGASRLQLKLDNHFQIEEQLIGSIIERLKNSEPIQYILEEEWFAGLSFMVNHHVLIPRPETEELVQWILNDLKIRSSHQLKIIDIGTGSGCIPIVLKKTLPDLEVLAIDISQQALEIARKNAHKFQTEIQFIEDDILNPVINHVSMFDIIVSNPPYITIEEKDEMNNRVLEFEPHQALFVTNQDPLQFYKAILKFAQDNLNENGIVYLEVNQAYGSETQELFNQANFETTLRNDMYGNSRMLKAQKKNLPI